MSNATGHLLRNRAKRNRLLNLDVVSRWREVMAAGGNIHSTGNVKTNTSRTLAANCGNVQAGGKSSDEQVVCQAP
jgi:hypothetical protein